MVWLITGQWGICGVEAADEKDEREAEVLLNGMWGRAAAGPGGTSFCSMSKAGAMRKVVARNHQVLVNSAVAAVARQEELKRRFPGRALIT